MYRFSDFANWFLEMFTLKLREERVALFFATVIATIISALVAYALLTLGYVVVAVVAPVIVFLFFLWNVYQVLCFLITGIEMILSKDC